MGRREELSEQERKAFLKSITRASEDDKRERVGCLVVGLLGLVFAAIDVAYFVYFGLGGVNRGVAMLLIVEVAAIGGAYRWVTRTR